MNQLLSKLNKQKRQITKELAAIHDKVETLRSKKLEYVHLYTDGVISLEALKEYHEIADSMIRILLIEIEQLEKQLQECEEENYVINLRDKLKDVLTLKEITPQLLHSLVSRIDCKSDGTVTIHYTFVNPFQET